MVVRLAPRFRSLSTLVLIGIVLLILAAALPRSIEVMAPVARTLSRPQAARAERVLDQLPLYWIENQGQLDDQVAYYVQGVDKTLYFTSDGVTLALNGPSSDVEPAAPQTALYEAALDRADRPPHAVQRWVVQLEFVGANRVRPLAEDKTGAVVSYFSGPQAQWHAGLSTYSRIVYRELWPGIDLVYYGTVGQLKYEFVVHPGADPAQIQLAYHGATGVGLNEAGQIEVQTPVGGFHDDTPLAYQEMDGGRVDVAVAYRLLASGDPEAAAYTLAVGDYDPRLPLILDPAILVYCGYIGGSDDEYGNGIAVDWEGNAYITGETSSTNATFPVVAGPDLTFGGTYDAFVAKVSAAGTALVYCGYIGGAGEDEGWGIAVDGAGNAYIAGKTSSTETTFPVVAGPDLVYNGGTFDAFVAKVNAAGTALDYCGYIGGSGEDVGWGIAVDGSSRAYVVGYTDSTQSTFPVVTGPDLIYNGGYRDGFVAKVNGTGTALVYCGYIGGDNNDGIRGVAVGGAGRAYVSGYSVSTEATFPVLVGPDLTHNGGRDAFVATVNAAGTALDYCGYIGGPEYDSGWSIVTDGANGAYVTGVTGSTESTFPVVVGPDLTFNGGSYDAFVARVSVSGAALDYCGYIGGASDDGSQGIAIDAEGSVYVTGDTVSTEATFPVVGGPDLTFGGGYRDAFVAKINAAGTGLVYCGYIGGAGDDVGMGIAVDGAGDAYVAGYTSSTQAAFPVTGGPDLTYNGLCDVFVARVHGFSEYKVYLPVAVSEYAYIWEDCGDSRTEGACQIGGCGFVLSAYADDTEDWYAFNLGTDQALTVRVTNVLPKTQLMLYDSAGQRLAHDGSTDTTKTVSHASLREGYVRVYTPSDYSTSALYTMVLSCP